MAATNFCEMYDCRTTEFFRIDRFSDIFVPYHFKFIEYADGHSSPFHMSYLADGNDWRGSATNKSITPGHGFPLDTDDDGYPTIEANHEDAVSHYIMYKYKARDYYNQKLPRYIYMDMKMEWNRLCAQARGNDNMPNRNQMRNISKVWNSLIPIHPRYSNLDI